MLKNKRTKMNLIKCFGAVALLLCVGSVFAGTADADTIGGVAGTITDSFTNLGKMMVGVAYLAGFGFAIAAIFKFKQHKDNPTQIPIGTPIALLVIGVVLIFLPGVIKIGGGTAGLKEGGGFKGEGVKVVPGAES